MRELCTSVQSVTNDINNLLTSIENILPIITTYLALPAVKEPEPMPVNRPQYNEPAAIATTNNFSEPSPLAQEAASHPESAYTQPPIAQTAAPQAVPANAMPNNMPKLRPEDIQQLLNNPLVKNLMSSIMAPK